MSDLSIATRELFARTFVRQVGLKMPMFAMLMEHRRVNSKGGTYITYDLIKDDAVDEVQAYKAGDQLTSGQSEFLDQAKFTYKHAQVPISYNVDTEIQNQLGNSEVKRRDIVKLLVERAQDGIKHHLDERLHTTSTADGDAGIQSMYDACDHSRTYGTIASTTSANTYWNGSSYAGGWADRATAIVLSLSTIRTMINVVERYSDDGMKLYMFLPEGLHSKVEGLLEGKTSYQASNKENSKLVKYGFKTFQYKNVEFVKDSYMTTNSQTAYALLINPMTWEFRIHPSRAFTMTKFKDQSEINGGYDEQLARIKFSGNCCCSKPNANMWKSSVT